MKLGHDANKPFGNKIKTPFGVPTRHQERPIRAKPLEPMADRPAEEQNLAGNFVNTITPIINKLPVKVLPDYKPFAEAGIGIAKEAVESSGITKYCSFEPFKNYFNITNLYVLRKLLLVIAPYSETSEWRPQTPSDSPSFLPGRYDKHAPDLYIPFMALITHVLLVAFSLGTANAFSPTVLGIELFACMIIWSLECTMFKFLFYLYSISPGFCEIFAFLGYKFVGLALSDLLRVFTNNLFANCALAYFSFMMCAFMYRTLPRYTHQNTILQFAKNAEAQMTTLLAICGLLEIPIMWCYRLF